MTEVKLLGLTPKHVDLLSEELNKIEQKYKLMPSYTIEQVYVILHNNKELFNGCIVTADTNTSFLSITTIYVQKII